MRYRSVFVSLLLLIFAFAIPCDVRAQLGEAFEQQFTVYMEMAKTLDNLSAAEKRSWLPTEAEREATLIVLALRDSQGAVLLKQLTSAAPGKAGLKKSEAFLALMYYQAQNDEFLEMMKRFSPMTLEERHAILKTKTAQDVVEAIISMRIWESKYGSEDRKRELKKQYDEMYERVMNPGASKAGK